MRDNAKDAPPAGEPRPPQPSALEKRVGAESTALSPKRRELMRRILADPEGTFHLSARRLAKRFHVDPATIVRMAQSLGYEGFSDFAEDLRQHFVTHVTPYSVMRAATEERSTTADHVAHVLETDLVNLSRVQSTLDTDVLEDAARQICQSRNILVAGMDLAHTLSSWLAYSLAVIGVNADAPAERALLHYKTNLLTRDDTLVAITFRQCMKSTVEALILAKERGAYTIAITDSPSNPAGRRADVSLIASLEGPIVAGSLVAPMGLMDALVIACAHSRPQRALDALRVVHDSYLHSGRYWSDANERKS